MIDRHHLPSNTPRPTGPLRDLRGIFDAWWTGSRGTIWFWAVPLFLLFVAVTTVIGWFR